MGSNLDGENISFADLIWIEDWNRSSNWLLAGLRMATACLFCRNKRDIYL